MRPPASRGRSAALTAMFFFSGASGLVYEVVWLRMLIRAFGVTVYAVSTVLVVFMVGLAAGSMTLGARLRRRGDMLAVYGWLEVAIGVSALAATMLILSFPALMPALSRSSGALVVARFLLASVALVAPTFLMGATLPVLSGVLSQSSDDVARRSGLLYGVNTLGAVLGVLWSGFFSLLLLGEQGTLYVAAATNVVVGVIALVLARGGRRARDAEQEPAKATKAPAGARPILLVYAASGFCALAYQVVWFRISTVLLGNSVYAFSLMLAAYLGGIGLGSVLSARGKGTKPLFVFAMLEVLVSVLALLSVRTFVYLGKVDVDPMHGYAQIWHPADFARLAVDAIAVVMPATTMMGAMFPLASGLVASPSESPEVSVGRLYGYNTVGAIFGSFGAGFVFVPYLGTLKTLLVTSVLSCVLGLVLLGLSARREHLLGARAWGAGAVAAVAALFAFSLDDPFYEVFAVGLPPDHHTLAHLEDKNATVTLLSDDKGERHLYINGMSVSDTNPRLSELMIDIPLAFHPGAERSLIVGLGVGEAFKGSVDRGLDTTVVDLAPNVVELFRRFDPNGDRYLRHEKATVAIGDGRNYLLSSTDAFDLVFVDVTPPVYASGMVNLYSYEFVRLVRDHLRPGGVFALWFPTVCFASDFWMIARNFGDVFPSVSLWTGEIGGILVLGSTAEGAFDVSPETVDARLADVGRPKRQLTGAVIREGQALTDAQIRAYAAHYPRVTDDRPYTEFPLLKFLSREKYYLLETSFLDDAR